MSTLRRFGLDALVVVVACATAASVLAAGAAHAGVVATVSAASLLVYLGRRLSPLAAAVASFGLLAVAMAMQPHSTVVQFVAQLLSFALAGAINRGRDLVVAAVCGTGLLAYATFGIPTGGGLGDFVLSAAIALGFLTAGWQVSRRGHLLAEANQTALAAQQAQEASTREAVVEERARIARELHDVVSHGLSVVVVQSQAARGALETPEETAVVARRLDAIEETARQALGEMRRMLGLLQVEDASVSTPQPPSPGIRDLPSLLETARSAGCPVTADLADLLDADDVGAGEALAVYRIVQESLTNVLKHAPGAPAAVRVAKVGDAVEVVVSERARPRRPDRSRRRLTARARGHARTRPDVRRLVRCRARRGRRVRGPGRAAARPGAREHPPVTPIRVLIADDQSLVRDGFRALLEREQDIDRRRRGLRRCRGHRARSSATDRTSS